MWKYYMHTWKVAGIRKRKLFRTLSLFASPHQTIAFLSLHSHTFFVWIWEFSVNTYYLLLLPTFSIVNIYLLCWCTLFWLLVWFWATLSIKYMVEYKQNLKTEDKAAVLTKYFSCTKVYFLVRLFSLSLSLRFLSLNKVRWFGRGE